MNENAAYHGFEIQFELHGILTYVMSSQKNKDLKKLLNYILEVSPQQP